MTARDQLAAAHEAMTPAMVGHELWRPKWPS